MKNYHLLIITIALFLVALNLVSATPNLEIKKIDRGSVILSELNNPAVFDFIIDNKNEFDTFEIYSLLSVTMTPKNKFSLAPGTTTVEVRAYLSEKIRKETKGYYKFEYQIKGLNSGIFKDKLMVKIMPLKEVMTINAKPIHPDDKKAVINIRNKENAHLENMLIKIESPFFSETKRITLGPYDNFDVSIDLKELDEEIAAGQYLVNVNVQLQEQSTELETTVNYLEKESLSQRQFSQGLIFRKTTLEKTNEGNIPVPATIELKKDVVSRLFTLNYPEPASIERNGLAVIYTWQTLLNPNESFTVKSSTNYIAPFLILLVVISVALFTKMYSLTAIKLNKKVSLVRTKGGELALKVNLHAKARRNVENIQIIDSLPAMTKLYEDYGKRPDKIDHHTKRIFWNVNNLSSGEERVFSYIIYSRLNVTGRFELSPALAIFQHEGKSKEVLSNRAFFASEKS